MAKYLKPRRGTRNNADTQNLFLQRGEMFLEMSNNDAIGKGPGRIIIGDGATSYRNINYNSTVANTFRPFITDPSIYAPQFSNTTVPSSGWSVNSASNIINTEMGNGTTANAVLLPTIIGKIKQALALHDSSITKLNNDLGNKLNAPTATTTRLVNRTLPTVAKDTNTNYFSFGEHFGIVVDINAATNATTSMYSDCNKITIRDNANSAVGIHGCGQVSLTGQYGDIIRTDGWGVFGNTVNLSTAIFKGFAYEAAKTWQPIVNVRSGGFTPTYSTRTGSYWRYGPLIIWNCNVRGSYGTATFSTQHYLTVSLPTLNGNNTSGAIIPITVQPEWLSNIGHIGTSTDVISHGSNKAVCPFYNGNGSTASPYRVEFFYTSMNVVPTANQSFGIMLFGAYLDLSKM